MSPSSEAWPSSGPKCRYKPAASPHSPNCSCSSFFPPPMALSHPNPRGRLAGSSWGIKQATLHWQSTSCHTRCLLRARQSRYYDLGTYHSTQYCPKHIPSQGQGLGDFSLFTYGQCEVPVGGVGGAAALPVLVVRGGGSGVGVGGEALGAPVVLQGPTGLGNGRPGPAIYPYWA